MRIIKRAYYEKNKASEENVFFDLLGMLFD